MNMETFWKLQVISSQKWNLEFLHNSASVIYTFELILLEL